MRDFCNVYTMDVERRTSLLKLLELRDEDHKIARLLHRQFLEKHAEKIVDGFYSYLLQHNEYKLLISEDSIPALKQTQAAYVRSFGIDFDSSDYFNHRLRVGLAHKKVGLTLGLYQCAYRELQRLIISDIPDGFMEEGISSRDLWLFIHKITALDMTLAIETYHNALVTDVQEELNDVHDEKAALSEQVRTDSLTGLFTRDYGIAILEKCLSQEDEKNQLCLIMADIDLFKSVNDTYGHLAGDEVLRQTANLLTSAVRDLDTVSRFGGEEFLIVLRQSTAETALKVAERIRDLVSKTATRFEAENIHTTISQGVAVVESESDTMQLLNKADIALYKAKQQGRDCIVMSGADVTRD